VKYDNWFFVDVEARGVSPVNGTMTEFGVVHFNTEQSFHGRLFEGTPDPENPAVPIVGERIADGFDVAMRLSVWLDKLNNGRATLWSDNCAYDFMWMAGLYDAEGLPNPFGHSGRRISDFYAGLTKKVGNTQEWKSFRKTEHDHHPVHDALGNVEAMKTILEYWG
jgi:hypothetical protein